MFRRVFPNLDRPNGHQVGRRGVRALSLALGRWQPCLILDNWLRVGDGMGICKGTVVMPHDAASPFKLDDSR